METYCITCKYFSSGNGASRDNRDYFNSQRSLCRKRVKNNRYVSVKRMSSCDKWVASSRRFPHMDEIVDRVKKKVD